MVVVVVMMMFNLVVAAYLNEKEQHLGLISASNGLLELVLLYFSLSLCFVQ